MKTAFTINGQVSIILEPETKLERVALEEMMDQANKGTFFTLNTMGDMDTQRFIITARS